MRWLIAALVVGVLAVAGAMVPWDRADEPSRPGTTVGAPLPTAPAVPLEPRARKPLAGVRVALDPGHQLGNRNFPAQVNRQVDAGGFTKPCNTTGTATDAGYPEATFTWQVARQLRKRLVRLGAKVRMTRSSNRDDRWGPCVDERGRFGAEVRAEVLVSIHADGSLAPGARGFHVIAPGDRAPWTDDIHAPSLKLARALRRALVRAGVPKANYVAGGTGLDVRTDLGTLNLSDVPAVMVELGNMRSPADARLMTTARGRRVYVRALVSGIRHHVQ